MQDRLEGQCLVRRKWMLFAVFGLLVTGCLDGGVGAFVDEVIEDPQVANLSDGRVHATELAGLEVDSLGSAHSDEKTEALLESGFRHGTGDELLKLKLALVPSAVMFALERGDGDTSVVVDSRWLGQIDIALDDAIREAGYEPPLHGGVDGVGDVAARGLLGLVAQSYGYEVDDPVVDKVRVELNGFDFEPVMGHIANSEQRSLSVYYQVFHVMWQRGHLVLPLDEIPDGDTFPPMPSADSLVVDPVFIVDSGGDTIKGPNGKDLTLRDWFFNVAVNMLSAH